MKSRIISLGLVASLVCLLPQVAEAQIEMCIRDSTHAGWNFSTCLSQTGRLIVQNNSEVDSIDLSGTVMIEAKMM